MLTCRLVRGNRAMRCPFISNSLICRLSCGIAITPDGDTDIRLTAESVRMVVNAERIFRNSHTLTVRSSEPDTTLSSRVKTVDVTLLECQNTNVYTGMCRVIIFCTHSV